MRSRRVGFCSAAYQKCDDVIDSLLRKLKQKKTGGSIGPLMIP